MPRDGTRSSVNALAPFMKPAIRDFAIPSAVLVLATAVIGATNADLEISSRLFVDGAWPVGDRQPWRALYLLDRLPAILLGVCGLGAVVIGGFSRTRRSWIRPGLFLVLLLALGPGLIVNSVLKEYWGRPRPRQVVQFGGDQEFRHPWQMGIPHKGRSFPSGHASAAFSLGAPFFLLRRRNPRAAVCWLLAGLFFGALMSAARITQGGHFLSDTLWAWGVVHLTAVLLYYLLRLDR